MIHESSFRTSPKHNLQIHWLVFKPDFLYGALEAANSDVKEDTFKDREARLIQNKSEDVYALLGHKGSLKGVGESSYFPAIKCYLIYVTKTSDICA